MKPYDNALKIIRSICLALPESSEVAAWGHPTFRAGKKMFAAFGEDQGNLSLGMKMGFDRQEKLLEDPRFYPTSYAARQGWISLHIDGKTDVGEVKGMMLEAYPPGCAETNAENSGCRSPVRHKAIYRHCAAGIVMIKNQRSSPRGIGIAACVSRKCVPTAYRANYDFRTSYDLFFSASHGSVRRKTRRECKPNAN
jgi:predicted DNA-binding protein (MmcQ/YjbR family)